MTTSERKQLLDEYKKIEKELSGLLNKLLKKGYLQRYADMLWLAYRRLGEYLENIEEEIAEDECNR